MNNKVILGLVFALSFSLFIGSSQNVFAGPQIPISQADCLSHSTFHLATGGANQCLCDTGFSADPQGTNPFIPVCIPNPVGGMGIPIDSTALLLAGVQGSALWMIPAIVVAGAGIGIFSFKRSKKFSGKEDKS